MSSAPDVTEAPTGAERPPELRRSDAAQAAALASVQDLVPEAEVEPEAPSAPEPAEPEATAEPPQPPDPEPDPLDLDRELPEDLSSWLDEPDFEAEAEAEIATEEPQVEDPDADLGYTDETDEVRELRRRAIAAEKRAEHEARLRARGEQKNWRAEALQYFPLSEHMLDDLSDVTSKREYLRRARDEHTRLKPHIERYRERLTGTVVDEAQQIFKEARTEAESQYGKPTTGPGSAPLSATESEAKIEAARAEARKSGRLRGLYRAMMEEGK